MFFLVNGLSDFHRRLYLDIKFSVAYNFSMRALLDLMVSPPVRPYKERERTARLYFYTAFLFSDSLLLAFDKDIKPVTPILPIPIRTCP